MAFEGRSESELPAPAWRQQFRRRLLRWFDRSARDLPWRPSPGLYETWVSEIMLQQTQVTTVVPYYTRFLKRFPDIEVLASASEQQVLRFWEGLGYYRRARQLHAAARKIVEQHEGEFPTSIDQVRELPGIGRYTAGAILSIALNQRHPILEANTIRLLSRLVALREDPRSRAAQDRLWAFATALLPRRRVGDFNQALMELGSAVCTPRSPDCDQCPAAALCPTKAAALQDEIPRPKKKTRYTSVTEAAVIVRSNGRFLLRRCQRGERWEGMWDFPRFPVRQAGGSDLDAELLRGVAELTGLHVTLQAPLTTIQHGVTRFRITLICRLATCNRPGESTNDLKWVAHDDASDLPLSVTGRKIWKLLDDMRPA